MLRFSTQNTMVSMLAFAANPHTMNYQDLKCEFITAKSSVFY